MDQRPEPSGAAERRTRRKPAAPEPTPAGSPGDARGGGRNLAHAAIPEDGDARAMRMVAEAAARVVRAARAYANDARHGARLAREQAEAAREQARRARRNTDAEFRRRLAKKRLVSSPEDSAAAEAREGTMSKPGRGNGRQSSNEKP